MAYEIKLNPAVKATYKFIEQELEKLQPLLKHIAYLRQNGHLDMTKEEEDSLK